MANVKKRGKGCEPYFPQCYPVEDDFIDGGLQAAICSYIIHDILENGVNVIQRIVLHLGKILLVRLNSFGTRVSLAVFKLTDVSKRYVGEYE